MELKNGVGPGRLVITPDFQIGHVKNVTDVPGEIHKNGGNVELEMLVGPLKGQTRHIMGGYLEVLDQDTYRAHTKLLKERQQILDEGMSILHQGAANYSPDASR